MIRIGQVILGKYRVDQLIGTGGMGVVYQVWDLSRNVPLAMKVLNADVNDDPSQFRHFMREANALKKLSHPHIVPFYGSEVSGETAFLLESYIDGADLKQVMTNSPEKRLPIPEALAYLKAICAALGYAHSFGVIHCDIKPGNVMIDQGGNIFLTDFGIARHAESTTTTFSGAGTPGYMAPEQIRRERVTPATDIYSLGALLFEMLTGQRPFRGDERGSEMYGVTVGERIRYAHQYIAPPDPRVYNPSIPPALAQVILRCLAKDPAQRYQNTREVFLAACNAIGVHPDQVASRANLPAGIRIPTPGVSPTHPAQQAATQAASIYGPQGVQPAGGYHQYAQNAAAAPLNKSRMNAGLLVVIFGAVIVIGLIIIVSSLGGGSRRALPQEPIYMSPTPMANLQQPFPSNTLVLEGGNPPVSAPDLQATQDAYNQIVAATLQAEQTLIAYLTAQALPVIPTDTPIPPVNQPPTPTSAQIQMTGPVLLVYTSGLVGNSDIYSAAADGRSVRAEVTNSCDDSEPALSPDGRYIAFQSNCGSTYDIWREDFGSGSASLRLTKDNSHDEREPHWSPDGRKIAYRVSPVNDDRNSNGEIWIMDSDGGNAYFLGVMGRSPVFSPDMRYITYMSYTSDQWKIFVFELASRTVWQVSSDSAHSRWPAWSPDSQYVIYNTTDASINPDGIWYVSVRGGAPTKVIKGAGFGRPSWSSNGWIAFNSDKGIDIILPDGSQHQTIIVDKNAWAPAYSN